MLHPFGCKIYYLILGRNRSSLKNIFFPNQQLLKLFFVQQAHCAIFFQPLLVIPKICHFPPAVVFKHKIILEEFRRFLHHNKTQLAQHVSSQRREKAESRRSLSLLFRNSKSLDLRLKKMFSSSFFPFRALLFTGSKSIVVKCYSNKHSSE